MPNGEIAYTMCVVFDLTRPGHKPTIYQHRLGNPKEKQTSKNHNKIKFAYISWDLLYINPQTSISKRHISKISRNIAKKDSNRIYSLHWERDGEFASCARQIKYTYLPYDMTQTSASRMKNVTLLSWKTTTWSSS